MKKFIYLFCFFVASSLASRAQSVLPGITVTNINGKIIVSWKNAYKVPLATISIQRSYDSLRNYSTIGSVLNPQNLENGYADVNPPYNKMYYRVFIAFEGGSYIISQPVRPTKDTAAANTANEVRYPWQIDPNADPKLQQPPTPADAGPSYPSKWIYTAKDQNVVIHLPGAALKNYSVSFFDELEKPVFELNNLKEEYLIIEKVNFVKAGWYSFKLYESGKLVETNKFFIAKDGKVTNDPMRRPSNR
ncbi:MAG: hypothetical protein EOO03_15205 [Chitinophagaceae bacterium]|nr:MAG: hypothetical protein EOO03_15205 [Chitinophagaceae bacterium]